ncbi:hypothetical protein [Vampirovibrio sp.]|uniref:hypothetical protein n=1 Tax=Vampirovibrio sp. TaxID=2717857 RepID=UPI003593714A
MNNGYTTSNHLEDSGLAQLCQEPSLSNPEIFKPNHFYGNAQSLKRYAGFPDWYALKAVIQHGLYFYGGDFTAGSELDTQLPLFLPTTPKRAEIYQRLSHGRPAIPIGSAFLYAKQLIDQTHPVKATPKGTLAFPSHSTRYVKSRLNHEEFAERLINLPEKFHPITVSIYWRDYLDGEHLPYVKRGLSIITNGHMLDPDFSSRVYLNCRAHRYVCATDVGSHLFFAVESGCRFFLLPLSQPVELQAKEARHLVTTHAKDRSMYDEAYRLFSGPVDEVTFEQSAFVDSHLGKDCFKTPQELRKLLLWAEWMDKFHCPSFPPEANHHSGWAYRLPSWWKRKLQKRLK